MTEWGPVSIHGSGTATYYELRAINTTPATDLPGPATAITVTRSNTADSPTTPGAPADLTATAAWDDQGDTDTSNDVWDVTLSWTGFVDAADTIIDKYQYQQSVDGGDYTAWADISGSGATTNTHPFTGVAGTIYVFKLRGVDTGADPDVDGVPATSNPVTPGTPNAPTALMPNDPGGSSGSADLIDFDWVEDDVPGVTVTAYQYRYRAETGISWSKWADTTYAAESDGALPPLTDPGLEGSTKYDFQVRAMAGTIPSGPSNIARGITKGGGICARRTHRGDG